MDHSVVLVVKKIACDRDCEWTTAKVVEPSLARRFVNRLDVLGFEYKVVQENRHLRILVRRQNLEEVLDWIDELSNPRQKTPPVQRAVYRVEVCLLVAIPIGILVGTVVSNYFGIQSPASYAISGYFGLAAIALAIGLSSRFANR